MHSWTSRANGEALELNKEDISLRQMSSDRSQFWEAHVSQMQWSGLLTVLSCSDIRMVLTHEHVYILIHKHVQIWIRNKVFVFLFRLLLYVIVFKYLCICEYLCLTYIRAWPGKKHRYLNTFICILPHIWAVHYITKLNGSFYYNRHPNTCNIIQNQNYSINVYLRNSIFFSL